MRKAKMGLIGCGVRGKAVLPIIINAQAWGLLELVGVCDVVDKTAKQVGGEYHVPYYTSAEKMLEKDMDFVYICASDFHHHTLGKLAAEYGKHVLVEKPLGITLPCCDVLIEACKKAGVHYEVAEQYFRGPTDRAVMKIIRSGAIGHVLKAYAIDPAHNHTSDSGVCMDQGVHRMSEIRMYIGNEPVKVMGLTKTFSPEKQSPGVLHEDWGFALVEFDQGQVGACECSTAVWEDPNKDSYRKIIGTEGIIHVDARTSIIEGTISLRQKKNGKFINVPVRKNSYKTIKGIKVPEQILGFNIPESFGFSVIEKIVAKTDPEITWKNPYAKYNLIETGIGVIDELMSIANAAIYDKPPEYGINGRKDVETCIAWYESSLKGKPVKLPITSVTSYEKKVHEAYERLFDHDPTDI